MIEITKTQVCDNCVGETLFVLPDKHMVENKKALEDLRASMQHDCVRDLRDRQGQRYKEINVYFNHRDLSK